MALDVKVKIDLTKPAGKLGFGIPLILESGVETAIEYAECSSLADVETAGFGTDSNVYGAASLIFMQDDAPKTIAVCATEGTTAEWLAKSSNTDKSWRQLVTIGESSITRKDISAAIETLPGKMFFYTSSIDNITNIKPEDIAYDRTVVLMASMAMNDMKGYEAAALVGATAGKAPGSITYKNQILKGVSPIYLASTALETLHSKNCMTVIAKAGDNVTSEGKALSGEYIDIIDSKDYIIQQLEYKTQKALNTYDKIPYDNQGIAILEAIAVDVLNECYNNGMIATNEKGKPAYSVNYGLREETSEGDRAARKYIEGKFSFALSGAIHEVEITGEITV